MASAADVSTLFRILKANVVLDCATQVMPRAADDLREQKQALIAYLQSKVKAQDWHAVQDAASDIREIDAILHDRES